MHQTIAIETLSTGEEMQVECVTAPDAGREAQILPFLAHKPGHYRAHLEAAFAGACDDLETRFYIGLLDGQMVGNIMTVESRGVGILGHVHTRADQRRKGICRAIMGRQMEDFRARGGQALLLGTGYQSPAYWIYHHFGFRDLPGGSPGTMRYLRDEEPDFLARFFAPAPREVVPMRWAHWPGVALLATCQGPPYLRSLTFGAWGVTLLEDPYCRFLGRLRDDPHAAAAALEQPTGAVAAVATLIRDPLWPDVRLLDLFARPEVAAADLTALIRALPHPPGKTECFADPRDAPKVSALEQTGFFREAILPGQFREGDVWRDAWLYSRRDVPMS